MSSHSLVVWAGGLGAARPHICKGSTRARVEQTHAMSKSNELRGCFKYRVASPTQYLVKTGYGIDDVAFCKKTFHWPMQRVTVVDMRPREYKFEVKCNSRDLIPLVIPVVFTIAPFDPETAMESFVTYCRRMSGLDAEDRIKVVEGVIVGQTRVCCAGLGALELSADRDKFKLLVQERIQKDMTPYGLWVHNANISEVHDHGTDNKFFENLKLEALEKASADARAAVAQARARAKIAELEAKSATEIRQADIEASTQTANNARAQDVAASDTALAVKKSDLQRIALESVAIADVAVRAKRAELETGLARATALKVEQDLKARDLVAADVAAQVAARHAEGEAAASRTRADAGLVTEIRAADGLRAKRQAQADGLAAVIAAAGSSEAAAAFLAMDSGFFVDMAKQAAAAVQGLEPKINVWTTSTSSSSGVGGSFSAVMGDLFRGMPPLLEAVSQQTGTKVGVPSWLGATQSGLQTSDKRS